MCGKPRCLYADKKLNQPEHELLNHTLEDILYSCGGTIPLDFIVAEKGVTCGSEVSPHCYNNRLKSVFVQVCYVCGDIGVEPVDINKQHPLCDACKLSHTFRTRSKSKFLKRN